MNQFENKRGQITIFIVVAILVIAAAALLYLFAPGVKTIISDQPENPEEFIRQALQENIESKIELISLNGGDMEPDFTISSSGETSYGGTYDLGYLCYTDLYYLPCVIQPAGATLHPHMEKELKESIEPVVEEAFNSLKQSYEEQGYIVSVNPGEVEVRIMDKKIKINLDYEVLLEKEGTEKSDEFNIIVDSNLFQLINIVTNILQWEALTGDVAIEVYMENYGADGISVERERLTDGTKIYEVVSMNTDEKLQFAVRGGVFPPGV